MSLPDRRAFMRYWPGSQRYELNVPLDSHAHLFTTEQGWVEVPISILNAKDWEVYYPAAKILGEANDPVLQVIERTKREVARA